MTFSCQESLTQDWVVSTIIYFIIVICSLSLFGSLFAFFILHITTPILIWVLVLGSFNVFKNAFSKTSAVTKILRIHFRKSGKFRNGYIVFMKVWDEMRIWRSNYHGYNLITMVIWSNHLVPNFVSHFSIGMTRQFL